MQLFLFFSAKKSERDADVEKDKKNEFINLKTKILLIMSSLSSESGDPGNVGWSLHYCIRTKW